jgi:isopentenyl diphosphate isomerase/L-lactate dehydrogenase-like FMN-dependent dehydrogenase
MADDAAEVAAEDAVNVGDYAGVARQRLPAVVWDYLTAGAGSELTVRANLAALRRWALRPRVLVDVSTRTTSTTVLGRQVAAPLIVAPMAYHNLVHPEGELATAAAAGAEQLPLAVSTFAGRTLEETAGAITSPLWLQLYHLRDHGLMKELVWRAEQSGCHALVLTVDMPIMARRDRDLRNHFALPEHIGPANLTGLARAGSLAELAGRLMDPAPGWEAVERLCGTTRLPVVVKGILTAEDARLAQAGGAAAVVVSNHGGRQVDGAIASIDALPEVVDAVADPMEVYVDGGFRRGSDILKALALGARAVMVGRPVLWGLAAAGAAGVRHTLRLLQQELDVTMGNCGCPTVAHAGPALVRRTTDPLMMEVGE